MPPSEPWSAGQVVDDYRLDARLGQGGMGVVWRATHLPTGAARALKTLPAAADPDLLLRFRHEAEALARVDQHPRVARIHGVGCALGQHYLALELLEGGDLARRLRERGPLPPAAAVPLVAGLARGLAHVHAQGVLHRDLKPSNVLFDAAGAAKLVDFGLARAAGSAALTRTGDVLGTPASMAPEQALGLAAQDERTDVHGLGALLYECLTGRPPFGGGSVLEVLERVIREPPPPPRALAPGLPPALEREVLRALAKDPAARHPSARAFAEAIERALAPAPRRPRAAVAAGVLALAGLATAAALARRPAPPPAGPPAGPPAATEVVAAVGPAATPPSPAGPAAAESAGGALQPLDVIRAIPPLDRAALEALGAGPGWGTLVAGPDALVFRGQELKERAGKLADDRQARDALATARRLFRTAVDDPAGCPRAWFELGALHELGLGVAIDDRVAAACYAEAAAGDEPLALLRLGGALHRGELGLPPDPARAADLYRRRAARPEDDVHSRARARHGLVELGVARAGGVTLAEATALAEALRAEQPDDGRATLLLAQALLAAERVTEGVTLLREAIRAESAIQAEGVELLARTFEARGRAQDLAGLEAWLEAEEGASASLRYVRARRGARTPAGRAEAIRALTPLADPEGPRSPVKTRAQVALVELLLEEARDGRPQPARLERAERWLRASSPHGPRAARDLRARVLDPR